MSETTVKNSSLAKLEVLPKELLTIARRENAPYFDLDSDEDFQFDENRDARWNNLYLSQRAELLGYKDQAGDNWKRKQAYRKRQKHMNFSR